MLYMGRDQTPEERELFLDSVAGVKPLGDRERVRAFTEKTGLVPRELPSPVALTVEGDGVVISGRAPGVNRAQIAELRHGKLRPDATLDLHGQTARAAEASLRGFLLDAASTKHRCVLVIHGRGIHSEGVAVLRDTVMDALIGPMSGLVRGFATAAPADGGAGATYVLVRS
jgi:DNA-nicking Smr family endonuclease